jgi:hypothetical protein
VREGNQCSGEGGRLQREDRKRRWRKGERPGSRDGRREKGLGKRKRRAVKSRSEAHMDETFHISEVTSA